MADERLVLPSARPLNAETFLPAQVGVITPNARFYVRNHFDVPELDPASWGLSVTGLVDRPLRLSLANLRQRRLAARAPSLESAWLREQCGAGGDG